MLSEVSRWRIQFLWGYFPFISVVGGLIELGWKHQFWVTQQYCTGNIYIYIYIYNVITSNGEGDVIHAADLSIFLLGTQMNFSG